MDFFEYIAHVDKIIDRLGSVPGNIQWDATIKSIKHYKGKVVNVNTFDTLLRQSYPIKSAKLETDVPDWVFEASSCCLALVACNWPSKESTFNEHVLTDLLLPCLKDKTKFAMLYDCCLNLVEVVEHTLETTAGLGKAETAFLDCTSVWCRALLMAAGLETVLVRPDAATFIGDLRAVLDKKREVGSTFEAVGQAIEASDAWSYVKPFNANALHVLEVMPKIQAWNSAMNEAMGGDLDDKFTVTKGVLENQAEIIANLPGVLKPSFENYIVNFRESSVDQMAKDVD